MTNDSDWLKFAFVVKWFNHKILRQFFCFPYRSTRFFFLRYPIPLRILLASFYCLVVAVRGEINFFQIWHFLEVLYVFKKLKLVLRSSPLRLSGPMFRLSLAEWLSLAGHRIQYERA